jgi:hypothetical protein
MGLPLHACCWLTILPTILHGFGCISPLAEQAAVYAEWYQEILASRELNRSLKDPQMQHDKAPTSRMPSAEPTGVVVP